MDTYQIWTIAVLHAIVFGVGCGFLGARKKMGSTAGAVLGALLGIFGLIIVALSPTKDTSSMINQLQQYKHMREQGLINDIEYNHLKGKTLERSR